MIGSKKGQGNDRRSSKSALGRNTLGPRGHMRDLMQMRNNFVDDEAPNQDRRLNTDIYSDPPHIEQPDPLATSKSNQIRYSLKKGSDFANQTTQMTRANSKDTLDADKAS